MRELFVEQNFIIITISISITWDVVEVWTDSWCLPDEFQTLVRQQSEPKLWSQPVLHASRGYMSLPYTKQNSCNFYFILPNLWWHFWKQTHILFVHFDACLHLICLKSKEQLQMSNVDTNIFFRWYYQHTKVQRSKISKSVVNSTESDNYALSTPFSK